MMRELIREQIKLIRPLLPAHKPDNLLGPIIDGQCASPKWKIGDMLILATVQAAADNSQWYHVSYSYPNKTPTHADTCAVRSAMFRPDSVVVAVFPPESEYINHMEFCLHLWERIGPERLIPDLRVCLPWGQGLTI